MGYDKTDFKENMSIKSVQKGTVPGIPRWSPTVVLAFLDPRLLHSADGMWCNRRGVVISGEGALSRTYQGRGRANQTKLGSAIAYNRVWVNVWVPEEGNDLDTPLHH